MPLRCVLATLGLLVALPLRAAGPPPIEWVAAGHVGIATIDVSPDVTLLASGSIADHTIKLWDVSTGRFVRTLAAHYETVHGVAFTDDGSHLASAGGTAWGSGEVNVKLWNVADGTVVRTFGAPDVAEASSVAISPDGSLLACGRGYDVELYSVADGSFLRRMTGHGWFVFGLDFSPDATLLASASGDHSGRVWRTSDGALVSELNGHSSFVSGITFAGGGKLATSSWDMTLKTWDPATGSVQRTLTGHAGAVDDVDWHAGTSQIVSCDEQGVVKTWDSLSGANLVTIDDPDVESALLSVRIMPDGQSVIAGGADGHSRRWDLATRTRLTKYGHHAGTIGGVTFTTDGRCVSGGYDALGKVFDERSGAFLFDLRGHDDRINAVTVARGNAIAATAAGSPPPDTRDPTIKLWSMADGSLIRTLPGHAGGSFCAQFSPDGTVLASGGNDTLVKLWNATDGSVIRTMDHAWAVETLAWTPDGSTIISGASGDLSWWNASDGALIRRIPMAEGIVNTIAISRNGSLVAVSLEQYGNNVEIRRVSDGSLVRALAGHVNFPHGVAFSVDSTELLTGSGYDYSIRHWRVSDGTLLREWTRECGWGPLIALPIAVSPDGRRIFYGRGDATLVMATYPAAGTEDCGNGADDDGDGAVDCADGDCVGASECPELDCANGSDDDGDTLVDCNDPDCDAAPSCVETDCVNGVDDDADGEIDCFDLDCRGLPHCIETDCTNESDDDGDTLIDCRDPDCACTETQCEDLIDQDGDGLVDCDDPDCAVYLECVDRDGDGVPDESDCAPGEPGSFAAPVEVSFLFASKPPGGAGAIADLSWTDLAPVTGSAVRYDVATGVITELWADRGFARATCLATDVTLPSLRDDRTAPRTSDGWWYLPRARNSCGSGPWGAGTFGPRSMDSRPCD
jgi:WD40 repeat protein